MEPLFGVDINTSTSTEHVLDALEIRDCARSIVARSRMLRLTVLRDMVIDNYSEIRCDRGAVVLFVYGDLFIKNSSSIIAEGDGNIFIKTGGDLVMDSRASIRTCKAIDIPNDSVGAFRTKKRRIDSRNRQKAHGNIHIRSERDFRIRGGSMLWSGHINVQCDGAAVVTPPVDITSLRNNICIAATTRIDIDSAVHGQLNAKTQTILTLNGQTLEMTPNACD